MPRPCRLASTAITPSAARSRTRKRRLRYKLFHQIAELLQELLPARRPIDVVLGCVPAGCHGYCAYGSARFRVRVSSRLPEPFAIDVLIHEWAHALAWPRRNRCMYGCEPFAIRERRDHGVAWGRAYAKVYSAVGCDIIPQIHRAERAARRLRTKKGRK